MNLVENYFEQLKDFQSKYGIKTCFLIQVGAFYEVYGVKNIHNGNLSGSNIEELANLLELNLGNRHTKDKNHIYVGIGFRDYNLDKYLVKINNAGYSAVVFDQDNNVKNTTRSLSGIYSPGTQFSSNSDLISNNCSCIWIQLNPSSKKKPPTIIIGISSIDILTGKSYIYEYNTQYIPNSHTIYDQLEHFLSIFQPSEVIFISNLSEQDINKAVSYCSSSSKLHHIINLNDTDNFQTNEAINCEKQSFQNNILNSFFNDANSFFQEFQYYNIACNSYCFLLNFINTRNSSLVEKIIYPSFDCFNHQTYLANHTLKQLNIIDDANSYGKFSSVLTLLNKCITNMGKRSFKNILLSPSTNITDLSKEYNITEYAINNYEFVDYNRNQLTYIKDLEKLYRLIVLQKITPQSLYYFYNNLENILNIYNSVCDDNSIKSYFSHFISENIDSIVHEFSQLFSSTFIIEKCNTIDTLDFDENFFQPGISEDLDDSIEKYMDSMEILSCIQSYLNDVVASCEKKNKDTEFVKIHCTEKMGYSIIATKRRCTILMKNLIKEVVCLEYISPYSKKTKEFDFDTNNINLVHSSASNQAIVSDQIYKLCGSISSQRNIMKNRISETYSNFISELKVFHSHFENIIMFISSVDVLCCKAFLAKTFNYCKPEIDNKVNKSYVNIHGLRHCLLEHLQQDELYVSNDISLGMDTNGILLYGTNAVGKTSLIRALGISVIMAQAGLYVPCSSFVFFPYNKIFSRILNNDNMFKGLSTFAVEMLELRTILFSANENSLILGDELCSGTEYESAISIFVAGLQHLHSMKSSYIFATHLHEIAKYDEIKDIDTLVLKHMKVKYDHENDTLIYSRKLEDGPGESMYGLEVCKSLKLPPDFMNNAFTIREKYSTYNKSFLSMKPSHYNSQKIKGYCEKCKKELATEVHHLQHQKSANEDGFIGDFHKNNSGNLMSLCEDCHLAFHKSNKQHKKTKTSKGYVLEEI